MTTRRDSSQHHSLGPASEIRGLLGDLLDSKRVVGKWLFETGVEIESPCAVTRYLSAVPIEKSIRGFASALVHDVVHEHAVKPRCVDHDYVVDALAPDRADDALHVGVLPRRSRRRTHFLNMHPVEGSRDVRKDRIAIVQ